MQKRAFLVIFLAILAAGWLMAGCAALTSKQAPIPTPTVDPAVKAMINTTGMVVPARWSTLSMPAAGVVEELLVEEGQDVQAGAVMIRLQGQDSLKAAVAAAELELISAQQALTDLKENASVVKAQVQLRLANAQKALDKAKDGRESKNYKRADPSLIAAARADVIMAKDTFKTAEDTWSAFEGKDEEDVNRAYALAQYEAARRKRDQAIWNLNYLESMPDSLEVGVSEGQLVVAQAELEAAQREWERVKDGPDQRLLSLGQARLNTAQAQVEAARKALADLEMKAPFAGTISKIYIHTQEWTSPGQPVLQLADLKHLQVETTDLNEIDVARISLGDSASVTFDALPDGKVLGKVTRISSKPAEGAGVNYPVVLELAEVPDRLRWGMTAFADIQVGDRGE